VGKTLKKEVVQIQISWKINEAFLLFGLN